MATAMRARFRRLIKSGLALLGLALLVGCGMVYDEPLEPRGEANGDGQAAAELARTVQFVDGFEAGRQQAEAAHKPMLVFFTASWCDFCHQMADEAFDEPRIVELSRQFVCVRVDADAESDVCTRLGVRGYPTVQFLSPSGAPLTRVVGRRPAYQFALDMQTALQALAARDPSFSSSPTAAAILPGRSAR